MYRRNNAARNRRSNQNRGMMDHSFGSNMSYRTGALMARPLPFANDGAFARDRPAPFASEGSFHLQELDGLDLELALLKHKREIIEQQQQFLSYNDGYGRQQSNYSADGPQPLMQNFTKFYNDPPVPGHKRRGEDPWQDGSHPKRFSGPSDRSNVNRGQNRSFNRLKQTFKTPDPKPQSRPSLPSTSTPGGRGRKFNPTRVTKPKNADSSVKPLPSYPAAKRKEFVNKAANLDKTERKKKEDFLLTADKTPTPRMVGRLEMALGTIFKDVQKLHPETAPPLPFLIIRYIKQTIRDRIREVMIGKVVGRFTDIVKAYRAKYAADTDKEVLESAKSRPVPKRKFIDQSESPGEYFKTNMATLLRKKMDKMFDKLKVLYNKEQLKEDTKETTEEMQAEDEAKLEEAEEVEKASFTADVENKGETKKEKAEETEAVQEEKTEGKEVEFTKLDGEMKEYRSKYYERLMQDLIKMLLPDALLNHKEIILALLDIDEEYKRTKGFDESPGKYFKTNMATLLSKKIDEMFDKLKGLYNEEQLKENIKQTIEEMQAEDKAKSAEAEEAEKAIENKGETKEKKAEGTEAVKEKKTEGKEVEEMQTEDKAKSAEAEKAEKAIENKEETKEEKAEETEAVKEKKTEEKEEEVKTVQYSPKYYEKIMQNLIEMQLPDALPKYKENIMALLDIDEEYKETKASIIMKTEEIASHPADEVEVLEDCDMNDFKEKEVKTAVEQRTPLFSVKILGCPYLPKRHIMQEFLDCYNPSSINRHKSMKNLMFVGFQEKADFERILCASQTVIGAATLDIKVSDRTKQANKTNDSTAQDNQNDSIAEDDSTVKELEVGDTTVENADDAIEVKDDDSAH